MLRKPSNCPFKRVKITYGTITRKGIAWKEVNVICAIELADSVLLKKLKYFEVMLNIF